MDTMDPHRTGHVELVHQARGWVALSKAHMEKVKGDRVGMVGHAFQAGCESIPFPANRIARVAVDGFIQSQAESIENDTQYR